MIKMVVRYCLIEHIPIDQSPFHKAIRALGMEDASDRLSYEVEVGLEECTTTSLKQSERS